MHLCALATSKSEIHMIFRGLHNLKMLLSAFAYLLCDHKKLGAWELVLAVSLSLGPRALKAGNILFGNEIFGHKFSFHYWSDIFSLSKFTFQAYLAFSNMQKSPRTTANGFRNLSLVNQGVHLESHL